MSTVSPRHASHSEMWIHARAHIKRNGTPTPRHARPTRRDTRAICPIADRAPSRLRRIARVISGRPANGKHGAIA